MDNETVQSLEERVGRWLDALNLDLDYRVTPGEEGNVVELKGPDEGIFLEADGKLLLAFQYLMNRVEERHNGPRVIDRKSTRLNSSHIQKSRMPSSA